MKKKDSCFAIAMMVMVMLIVTLPVNAQTSERGPTYDGPATRDLVNTMLEAHGWQLQCTVLNARLGPVWDSSPFVHSDGGTGAP
jgi:hypothetical protein